MARVVTIASQTGGVGKTTTALNLGYLLSRLGERVLLVDIDPQGGMTVASNVRKKTDRGLAQLLSGQATREEVVVQSRLQGIAVVGSGANTPEDTWLLEDAARDGSLTTLLRQLAEGYTYTFVDAPAGVGRIVAATLAASDSVILVVRPRALNLKTLPVFLRLVKFVRDHHNPGLRLEGALVTMRDETSGVEEGLIVELESTLPPELLFRAVVGYDERFEEASIEALPIALLPDGREPARSYLELALEIKERDLLRCVGGDADADAQGLF